MTKGQAKEYPNDLVANSADLSPVKISFSFEDTKLFIFLKSHFIE